MKLLYVGLLYNYGNKDEGFSYEHFNLEAGFRDCAEKGLFEVDFLHPDNCPDIQASAVEHVIDCHYDAIFHVAFNEDLDFPERAAKMALKRDIPVIQWDCDSSWRFAKSILPRHDRVSHFVTTHSQAVAWYEQNGLNVIRSQWGGSPYYQSKGLEKKYAVTFIGQKHGQYQHGKGRRFVRGDIINRINAAGIQVDLFGNYWDGYSNWHGYVKDFHRMIDIFDQSLICLNLSNPWHVGTMPQIKGRHFEIPQIAGCQICTPADDLESYFEDGKEIVIARSDDDLIDKLKYYLDQPEERLTIAQAGHARMLRDHQWLHRFEGIFEEMGLM